MEGNAQMQRSREEGRDPWVLVAGGGSWAVGRVRLNGVW